MVEIGHFLLHIIIIGFAMKNFIHFSFFTSLTETFTYVFLAQKELKRDRFV